MIVPRSDDGGDSVLSTPAVGYRTIRRKPVRKTTLSKRTIQSHRGAVNSKWTVFAQVLGDGRYGYKDTSERHLPL